MRIGLISCVKTKLQNTNKPVRARDLYISPLFKKSLAYCLEHYDEVFILSAYYGLIDLDAEIVTYEKTLNNMSKSERERWYDRVADEMRFFFEDDKLYYHCGIPYRSGLIDRLSNEYEIPLKGVSFGNQLKFYTNELNRQSKLF